MNLIYEHPCAPLRLLVVNPTTEAGVLFCAKALRGVIFGMYQMIDLTLLVYSNELEKAQQLKWDLDGVAFPCNNTTTVTSDLPSFSDADIFVFVTEFPSLNTIDFSKIDEDVTFDTLYLLLKIANNLEMPPPPDQPTEEPLTNIRRSKKKERKPHRPIIVTDGVVALDIVKTFSKNLPNDIFFCPTSIANVARNILADKLGVKCTQLNNVYVYAANDKIFHVDVDVPLYVDEKFKDRDHCEWSAMSNREYEDLELELTQFNAAWMKKEYIQKIAAISGTCPNGSIYKAAILGRMLQMIWKTRSIDPVPNCKFNLGVISDGTFGTLKGLPYVMPLIFQGEGYKINDYLKDDFYLKKEIKRMNKAVQAHHSQLILYCKQFLKKNVIKLDFLPKIDDSTIDDYTSTTIFTKTP